ADANLYVHSDLDSLTKIVGNLLTNALKFAYTKITLKLVKNHDKSFTVSVEDDGLGIPDDLKNLVFDPFYQIQSSEENVGTGIGLSLVKHLTGVLNAEIRVIDGNTCGSIFLFTFSDIQEDDSRKMNAIKPANLKTKILPFTEMSSLSIELTESTVLVIDDNPDMTAFIKNCLSGDYLVDTAEHATEALTLLKEKNYNLIISDIMMPDVDGISLV